ncbi:MAG: hypothetical protein ACTHU0_21825 [Kofleriaceae bacterium]
MLAPDLSPEERQRQRAAFFAEAARYPDPPTPAGIIIPLSATRWPAGQKFIREADVLGIPVTIERPT